MANDPSRRRFAKRAIVSSALALIICIPLGNTVGKHYKIGLDLGEFRCLPWHVYLVELGRPSGLERGDYVAFIARDGIMGDRFQGRMIGKMVAGLPGDKVTVKDDFATVNGMPVGELTLLARLGKKSHDFDRTAIVPEGKVFVVGTEPRSYDGRYWGFLDQSFLIGRVKPLY
ncbi:signal peptidase I [Noviherbaspirillum sp. CPCC 100848]|uniref:Signal peptidase I n=1 Tax=Noviherbaspirillum album TaxID=3080276 RepID=A0ABU6JA07_9BURK|nr:signal peptidase I [Noviherbaspirillum sp. CPCC 100848]MEC4720482.1 signal peptidase I [Noviherbaspirillum sp. CPCC 100848]